MVVDSHTSEHRVPITVSMWCPVVHATTGSANGFAYRCYVNRGMDVVGITVRVRTEPTMAAHRTGGYDSKDFAAECRDLNVTPHVAQKRRWSTIDGRATHEPETCRVRRCALSGVYLRVDEDGWRVPSEPFCWSGEYLAVWRVGCDGLQPIEDVEVDS